MSDEDTPLGSLKPREPDDHDVTGTGTPRSADDGLPQRSSEATNRGDRAVETGMEVSSQPAFSDGLTINRSGSGGSGGPVDGSEDLAGSTGQSMSELLSGEDDSKPPAR